MFRTRQQDQTQFIELNHGKVNAMDLEFCEQLIGQFESARHDQDVSAVVLTGNGTVFSAGIDLKRWLREGPEYVQPFMLCLEQLFETVFCFPKPVIALIDGPAIAGGCMLATACDFRLISSSAKIGILESRLGVPLPMTAIEIVRHVANPSAFAKIISVGATFVGDKAVEAGLADVSADSANLKVRLSESIDEFTAIPSPAFELTKQQARLPVMRIVQQNKAELLEKYLAIWNSQQTRDSIAAYVQQRLG